MDEKTLPIEKTPAAGDKAADKARVQAVLERIRPALQADGGDVQLVDVAQGTVKLRLTGHCGSCPMSTLTLKNGIERILRQEIPEVKEVVSA